MGRGEVLYPCCLCQKCHRCCAVRCSQRALCQRPSASCPHAALQTQPGLATALNSVSRLCPDFTCHQALLARSSSGECADHNEPDASAFGKTSLSWDYPINSYTTHASLELMKIASLLLQLVSAMSSCSIPPDCLCSRFFLPNIAADPESVTIPKWNSTVKSDSVESAAK